MKKEVQVFMGAFRRDNKEEFTNKMKGRVLLGKKQNYKGLQARQAMRHAWPK